MPDFLEECQVHFGTKKLYEILDVKRDASNAEIKSAYRKKSLKVHPDRASEQQKDTAKEAFQTLSKVYSILSNEESRRVYDDTGIIVTDDDATLNFETFEDAVKFWRNVFPKITTKQIDEFANTYIGSNEEKKDLCDIYERFEGDLDKIYQYHMFYDEDRVQEMLHSMINDGTVTAYGAFVNEDPAKTRKRVRMIEKEKKESERHTKRKNAKGKAANDGEIDDDLMSAILANRERRFENTISSLEEKYGKKSATKRSRVD